MAEYNQNAELHPSPGGGALFARLSPTGHDRFILLRHTNVEEGQMVHYPANAAAASPSDTKLRGLLGGMSVFTMIMTVPQVWPYGWVIKQRGFRSSRGARI